MRSNTCKSPLISRMVLGGAALCLLLSLSAQAQVVPPGQSVGGVSQHDWAIRWYQWNMPMGVATNPALDSTGAQAFRGDVSPDVFFLAGTWGGGIISANRTITVPEGKNLLFPLINWYVDNTNYFGQPPTNFTAGGMLTKDFGVNISGSMDKATGFAELDGATLANPLAGRQILGDPGFPVTYTDPDNIPAFFGADATLNTGVYPSTVDPTGGDAYFMMLSPLSVGDHKLHFGGSGDLLDLTGQAVGIFGQDVTYNIRVVAVPEPGMVALLGGLSLVGAGFCLRRRK